MSNVWALCALAALILFIGTAWRRARPARGRSVTQDTGARFGRLVALCYGDSAMAERLVAGEARRSMGILRDEQVERAIQRLLDDRRR